MTRTTLASLALSAVLVACTPPEDDTDTTDTTDTEETDTEDTESDDTDDTDETVETARVRVIHASPDAPPVDVWVQGVDDPIIEDLDYGETTAYLPLVEGSYTIEVRAAGSAGSTTAAHTQTLAVPASGDVTVIAAGLLGGTGDESFRLLALAEDFETPAANTARVRVVHASATAPTVAIDVGDDAATAADAEIASLALYAETGAAGVALPAETALQLAVWTAGMSGVRVTAFTTPELPDGGELFVIATGLLEDKPREETGFSLLAVAPTGTVGFIKQNPRVHALHASPDAPAVDIFAGSAELVDNLDFEELSGTLQVPPGTYTLDFFAHEAGSTRPGGNPAASATTPALEAGEAYLAIAAGLLGSTDAADTFRLVPLVDGFTLGEDKAVLRAVHGSPDAPAVDIGTVDGSGDMDAIVWSNVSFPQAGAAAGVALDAGDYDLGVAATGSTTPVATFSGVTLPATSRLFVVATGTLADDQTPFGLTVIDATGDTWSKVDTVRPDSD